MAEKRNYADVTTYGPRDRDPGNIAADSVLDSAHAGTGALSMVGGVESYIPGAKDSLRDGGSFSSGSCRAWNSVNALDRSSNWGVDQQ